MSHRRGSIDAGPRIHLSLMNSLAIDEDMICDMSLDLSSNLCRSHWVSTCFDPFK